MYYRRGNVNIKYLSDLIKKEDMQSWNPEKIVLLSAGTGKGKTTLIVGGKEGVYSLTDYAKANNKKILYLVNREVLEKQIDMVVDEEVVEVMTYQKLEFKLNYKNYKDVEGYEYIVADESHYFFTDSNFNSTSDLSLSWILGQKSIRIFMTATGDLVKRYIAGHKGMKVKEYEILTDYNYINLYFYDEDKTIIDIFKNIDDDKKGIYFANSIKKAYKMSKDLKNTSFICSKHNKKYSRYMDMQARESIEKNERFENKILCTTMTLDNGINIDDESVKHIAIDMFDIDILQQCIGRKRMGESEGKINVYIKNISNQQIGGRMTSIKADREEAKKLEDMGVHDYISEKIKHNNLGSMIDIIKNENGEIDLRVNKMKDFKGLYDLVNIEKILTKNYISFVCKRLKKYDYERIEKIIEKKTLKEYLNSVVGQKLYKKEQNILKDIFRNNGLNSRTVGFNTINGNIRDRGFNYTLTQGKRKSYRDDEGKVKKEKSHWILEQVV